MNIFKSLLGRREHTNWNYASQPHPALSLTWNDDFWPVKEWYYMSSTAVEKIVEHWQWDEPKVTKKLVRNLTKEQLLLWAVENIVGSVCNGGFRQAFYNSYGELAEESIIGLRTFGFDRHAEIFEEAFNQFGIRPVPRNRQARIDRLDILANHKEESSQGITFDHLSNLAQKTSRIWDELETEFFSLLQEKTDDDGYNSAYFRPLAEWIYYNRDRFFIV